MQEADYARANLHFKMHIMQKRGPAIQKSMWRAGRCFRCETFQPAGALIQRTATEAALV